MVGATTLRSPEEGDQGLFRRNIAPGGSPPAADARVVGMPCGTARSLSARYGAEPEGEWIMRRCQFIAVAAMWVAAVMIPTTAVRGDEIGLSSSAIEIRLDRSEIEGHFDVTNHADAARSLTVADGPFLVPGSDDAESRTEAERHPIAEIEFEPATFKLEPGRTQRVIYRIARRDQVLAGRYQCLLTVRGDGQDAEEATLVLNGTVGQEVRVRSGGAVDLGMVKDGKATYGVFQFDVEANVAAVRFRVNASDLFRVDENGEVVGDHTIALEASRGAEITPADAAPVDGENGHVDFTEQIDRMDDQSTRRSGWAVFRAAEANSAFVQQVFVRVWWRQERRVLPAGDYGGVVHLTAEVAPSP